MDKHINRAFEWVPSDLQPWVLVFLILSAFTAFTLSAWPKLSLLLKAGEENRLDQPLKRVFTTLCIAFGQKKLLQQEPRSGWMHALIFWGFLILLIRAGEFFVVGLFPQIDSHFSSTAPLILPYLWVKDGAVFMVTLATLYALYRRLVIKPDRLTLSGEGLLILCLILAIMVSDVLFDSAFLALNPDIKSSGPLAHPVGKGLDRASAQPGLLDACVRHPFFPDASSTEQTLSYSDSHPECFSVQLESGKWPASNQL